MTVHANNQQLIVAGETVTMNLTLDEVVVEGMGGIDTLFTVTENKTFCTFDNNDTIVLQVGIADERTEDYVQQN